MVSNTTDKVENEAVQAIEQMIDIQWSTNWSELPTEAEGHVEQAYEHLLKAEELADE